MAINKLLKPFIAPYCLPTTPLFILATFHLLGSAPLLLLLTLLLLNLAWLLTRPTARLDLASWFAFWAL